MRILLIGSAPRVFGVGNVQWFNDTASALRRLGHMVTAFSYRERWSASAVVASSARRVGMSRALRRYQHAQQLRRDRQLLRLASSLRPDLVLVLKGEQLGGDVLAQLKRASPGVLAAWWTDDPWDYPAVPERLTVFDHVFIWDRSYLARLSATGVRRSHFLPCACNERVYGPMRLDRKTYRRFGCDVAFVAWFCPEREPVIRALAQEVDLGVWGGGWRSLEDVRTPGDTPVLRGSAVGPLIAATIYNASKLGLNIHAAHTRLGGLNTRSFELPASGVCQLMDYVEGMGELLTPGVEVVCYRSSQEARELARRYLSDDEARADIAARGRSRVLDQHTYVARMRTLCELAR